MGLELTSRILDMAIAFVPKPIVSAVQLCGRVSLGVTGKGKIYKHFAGLERWGFGNGRFGSSKKK